MSDEKIIPNSSRKLFFGLFIFPLVIAVGMAVLLCGVVLMTHEDQTPETLIADIKNAPEGKRWQKAFELSNELRRAASGPRSDAVIGEIVQILRDPVHYDTKTRAYMALALSHRASDISVRALRLALKDEEEDVRIYALWSLGVLKAREASEDIAPFLRDESLELRKTAAYVLGAIGDASKTGELRGLLADPSSDVRWNAALALARLGDDAGGPILIGMMRREDLSKQHQMNDEEIEAVMINAVKGLALIRGPEAVKILRSVSREDKSMKVRQAALDALNTKE